MSLFHLRTVGVRQLTRWMSADLRPYPASAFSDEAAAFNRRRSLAARILARRIGEHRGSRWLRYGRSNRVAIFLTRSIPTLQERRQKSLRAIQPHHNSVEQLPLL